MIRPLKLRVARAASLLLALCLAPSACTRDEQPAPQHAAATPTPIEPAPARAQFARVDRPDPPRPADPEPLVVAGRVVRPDGSPLERVLVALWAIDAAGQLAEVLAHTETATNGSFELPSADIARVSRLRFRWQALRQQQGMYDVVMPAVPFGPPVDVWLDRAEMADWASIKATVDTGWTLTGLVRSQGGRGLGEVRVTNTTDGRRVSLDWGARFAFLDIPWAVDACSIEVTESEESVATIEVSRPPPGSHESFTEIVIP